MGSSVMTGAAGVTDSVMVWVAAFTGKAVPIQIKRVKQHINHIFAFTVLVCCLFLVNIFFLRMLVNQNDQLIR
jgi:hypothetical protein